MAKFEDQEVQVQQHAVEVIDAAPKRKWQSYVWDSLGKSPEERHFLFKLDSAVLTFASLGKIENRSRQRQTLTYSHRLLHQVPRSEQYQQCFRQWNVCSW
jgi:methylphosphotriester-DNA--protein-cysteine methyltransferase